MATVKSKKNVKDDISVLVEEKKFFDYSDAVLKRPPFNSLRIVNGGDEAVQNLSVCIRGDEKAFVNCQTDIEELPYKSAFEPAFNGVLTPSYFLSATEAETLSFQVEVLRDKNVLAKTESAVTLVPFDCFCGLEGDCATVARLVRPNTSDADKILKEASAQLKKWKLSGEIAGYSGADKNEIRRLSAAIFMAIKHLNVQKSADTDLSKPSFAGGTQVLSTKSASALSLAVFAASCLERAGLNTLILLGKTEVACGVWLKDTSFLDPTHDDMLRIEKNVDEGVNNLSFFDVEDLFSDRTIGYPTAENHFLKKLTQGMYEVVTDIARCRMDRFLPLPVRAKSLGGYELLDEEGTGEVAPLDLKRFDIDLSGVKRTKNKGWERRLLDLSMRNSLLNFNAQKNALHVLSAGVDDTFSAIESGEKKLLSANATVADYKISETLAQKKDVLALENEHGILRIGADEKRLEEVASYLVRRGREAGEESGFTVLYLACGFLKWTAKGDEKEKYAPIVLQPVRLKKGKGGAPFTLTFADEDHSVNSTLLEYLKQEFDVDVRGLDVSAQGLSPSEILSAVRAEILTQKGWEVTDDIYIATFSFANYLLWKDLRRNMDEFKKNPLVSSLLNNKNELKEESVVGLKEDEEDPTSTLTPLSSDCSQFEAISLSRMGKTFVLHGPPGTGKSQTITNIIANAVNDGKRVLFVAEKQAALDVVKKRLDSIGIGDFCLSLNAGKTDKQDVVKRIETTLELGKGKRSAEAASSALADFMQGGENIQKLRTDIDSPLFALHKKRRLGVSVYRAMLLYLENKSAPDLMNIESTFYDGLTEKKLAEYESVLLSVSALARECGGVYNSPFDSVELFEYSTACRDGVYCASEVILAEIKHLKNYLGLFLELYRQKISTFTRRKAQLLTSLIGILTGGTLDHFFSEDETEFHLFYNANRRLDKSLANYLKYFKAVVDVKKELPRLRKASEDDFANYYNSKELTSVVRKLAKASIGGKMPETEAAKYLQNLLDVYDATEAVKTHTALSENFKGMFGAIDEKKRREYLSGLYRMHDIAGELFMDYNADSFNSMCKRAVCGYSRPALSGLLLALDCFARAENGFLASIGATKATVAGDDLFDFYSTKASSLIDNIDMLANWVNYKAVAREMKENGLKFMVDALENGVVTGDTVVPAFRKNVYKNFLDINIPVDPVLSTFSAAVLEETVEQLRLTSERFNEQSSEHIRDALIARLPSPDGEDRLGLELVTLTRLLKGKMRGVGIRTLFTEAPELMKVVAPCLLMSPLTVAQYLTPDVQFDTVIFDEASQMPTSEAIGSLARSKSAVIVGDPKQMPPTSFFANASYQDDDEEEGDMESILDDFLALGVPERYLLWHYRSRHESLIAFSNGMYYGGKLCTFPSPDSLLSKVSFHLVEDGLYDRGATKRNEIEAKALVEEVVRRLKDPVLSRLSMGIVTFSEVQRDYIERRLNRAISENGLEEVAFEREERLFIKNLENVQGDERDVILFSVCYGPDRFGKVSLNFGPLNQAGGWRRLNVAVSRAREEMVVFSSMTSAYIDLSKTSSKGVAGLKAFLEFAQKGRTSLAVDGKHTLRTDTIGKYVAEELSAYGFDCRRDVGASDFRIDVAVVDPHDKSRFILGIMLDSTTDYSCKDRNVLEIRTLKRSNWNIYRLYCVNYYNNPKRELKKIKETLDRITGADVRGGALARAKRVYKVAKLDKRTETAAFVTDGNNGAELINRIKAVVAAEEPISVGFLKKRVLSSLGIQKYGSKVDGVMETLIAGCLFKQEELLGERFVRKSDKYNNFDKYRVEEDEPVRKTEADFTPYDVIGFIRSALEDKVALYFDELLALLTATFKLNKPSEKFASFVMACVALGEKQGVLLRSCSDRISLA